MTPELYKKLRQVKSAIEEQIKDDVSSERTPMDTVTTLFKNQDSDIVKWFFAETVKVEDWDGRFSRQSREWAKQLYIPVLNGEDGDKYGRIGGEVHRAHLNQIVEKIIKI